MNEITRNGVVAGGAGGAATALLSHGATNAPIARSLARGAVGAGVAGGIGALTALGPHDFTAEPNLPVVSLLGGLTGGIIAGSSSNPAALAQPLRSRAATIAGGALLGASALGLLTEGIVTMNQHFHPPAPEPSERWNQREDHR